MTTASEDTSSVQLQVMVQSLLPSNDHLSAQPFINNCYSEMCMSSGAVGEFHAASVITINVIVVFSFVLGNDGNNDF